MGQMGESSKATVSFDQSLRDTTKSLTDLANAVPNEFITQEMIDKAKKRLEDLKNATPEYREMFNRRNVEQMISTGHRSRIPLLVLAIRRLAKIKLLISKTPTTAISKR